MAVVFSNPLNLFNLTVKAVPVGADLIPIGDSAVTGVPLKQATITSILAIAAAGNDVSFTTATETSVANTNYFVNYTGGQATITIPTAATSPLGTFIRVSGGEANTAGFKIALNASQQIRYFGAVTTVTTGFLVSPGAFDDMLIVCDDASGAGLTWKVMFASVSGSVSVQ
jgi:hypothetical protein